MIRRIVWLLAIVGVMVGLVVSQTGHAFMEIPRQQPCEEERRGPPATWFGGGSADTQSGGNFVGRPGGGELSNDADQCNGNIKQWGVNKPCADVDQKNKNFNPQFTLKGNNYQYNKQRNEADIDQSQEQEAAQVNAAGQSIVANEGPGSYSGGGGGAPLKNDADQTNQGIYQGAWNQPYTDLDQKNINFNPQFTVWGNNTEYNRQKNEADIDQSQEQEAAQVNATGQSIWRGPAPPVDPVNDADQSNGGIYQGAYNRPHTDLDQKNINFNPQVTVFGSNSQSNYQSNDADIDQSQEQEAAQANFAGQSLQQG
jgi:hypothetical protein